MTGYCTIDDLRRALRKKGLPGDAAQDSRIATDAIVGWTEPLEKALKRHWYAPTGSDILDEASEVDIPTGPMTRDDEHDIPTHSGYVHGASERDRWRRRENSDALLEAGPRYERRRPYYRVPKEEIRIATGDHRALDPPVDETVPAYTRIRFDRRDVEAINTLSVINAEGGYDDWVASSDYDGGVGNQYRGDDYWVRINNGGWSELYLDVHAMDDDIPSFANAVYVDIDYGHEGVPANVRRAVAMLAGADLVEEAVIEIPQNTTLYNIETKADEMRATAESLLSPYLDMDGDNLDFIQS